MIYFTHHRVVDLLPQEIDKLRGLSFGDEGYMCDDLDHILQTEQGRRYRYSFAIRARLYNRPHTVIGWSLVQPVYRRPNYTAQLFVHSDYRRQGIGGRLLEEANLYTPRPWVYLDGDNEEFFNMYPELCNINY